MALAHYIHELKMKRLQYKMRKVERYNHIWTQWAWYHGSHEHCDRCGRCLVDDEDGGAGLCKFHWSLFLAKENR